MEVIAANDETLCTSVCYRCLQDHVLLLLTGPQVGVLVVPHGQLHVGFVGSVGHDIYAHSDFQLGFFWQLGLDVHAFPLIPYFMTQFLHILLLFHQVLR